MISNNMRSMDVISSQNKLVLGFRANHRTDATISNKPLSCSFKRRCAIYKSKYAISAPRAISKSNEAESFGKDCFATSSRLGTPLFWVGVGFALSPVISWAASYLKKYAMEQAFKVMMGQMDTQHKQSSNASFSQGSAATSAPVSQHTVSAETHVTPARTESKDDNESPKEPKKSGMPQVPQNRQQVQDLLNKIEGSLIDSLKDLDSSSSELKEQLGEFGLTLEELTSKIKENLDNVKAIPFPNRRVQTTFMDFYENPMNIFKYLNDKEVMDHVNELLTTLFRVDPQMGTQNNQSGNVGFSQGSVATSAPALPRSVTVDVSPTKIEIALAATESKDAIELLNDPKKSGMLQNNKQVLDMHNNMGGSLELDSRLIDSLKYFDLNIPDIKEQLDQIGLTPEEVISKIMANPEVAMAFQSPRVQAIIMDMSKDPKSIIKYQNDKEIMDLFNKLSKLFPG